MGNMATGLQGYMGNMATGLQGYMGNKVNMGNRATAATAQQG